MKKHFSDDLPKKYQEELSKCSTCGFCHLFCPVYAATDNLSSCLLCRACLPSCSSGMTTDEIVRLGREASVNAKGSGIFKRIIFDSILPYPERTIFFIKAVFFIKRLRIIWGFIWLTEKLGVASEGLKFAATLLEDMPREFFRKKHESHRSNLKTGEKQVAYFPGCGFNYLVPEVGEATVQVIERLGYDVVLPETVCCGLPPYFYGYTLSTRELAKKNIQTLEGFETILSDCGSCSSFLKKYAELLSNDPEYAERASKLSGRVIDSNEFIYNNIDRLKFSSDVSRLMSHGLKVTYHDPCHLGRYHGITDEPREIIKAIPGIEFVDLPESDWCCGGAGTYSITNSAISMKILERKMNNVRKTGADILVTSCPSCMIQLSHGVKQFGLNIKVVHVNQMLASVFRCPEDDCY